MNLFKEKILSLFHMSLKEKTELLKPYEKRIRKCYADIFNLERELDKYRNFESNAKLISQNDKINYFGVTKNGEIVAVSYNGLDLKGNNIYLTNLCEKPNYGDCHISLEVYDDDKFIALLEMVHIQDIDPKQMLVISEFTSQYKNRGYGSTLLSHCCEIAKRKGFKYIVGELASADCRSHPQLERLYKRLGFEVHYLPERNRGVIIKYL